MSLIQRQDSLVAQLEAIYLNHFLDGYVGFSQATIGRRSKAKRLHAEAMIKDGYPKAQAWASANDCDQVAYLNASCKSVEQSLGVPA